MADSTAEHPGTESIEPPGDPRFRSVARVLLRWLYENPELRPDPAGFPSSPHAALVRPAVAPDELVPVIAWLAAVELVSTRGDWHGGMPARVGLTGSGLLCASRWGGDVAAWLTGSDEAAEVPEPRERVPEPSVRQSGEPTPAELGDPLDGVVRVARVLLLTLPTFDVPAEEERLARAARQLIEAAHAVPLAPSTVRTAARELRARMVDGELAETVGAVLVDGLDEELAAFELLHGGPPVQRG